MSTLSQFTGSGWDLIDTVEVTTATAQVALLSQIDDTFNNYVVVSTNTLSSPSAFIGCVLTTGGGTNITANYGSLAVWPGQTGSSSICNGSTANIAQYQGSFVAYFMNLRRSTPFKSISTQSTGYDGSSFYLRNYNNALIDSSLIDGIRFFTSGGAFNTGSEFTIYGLRGS